MLMYHSIEPSERTYSVTPEEFEKQMRFVKNKCVPVTLEQVVDHAIGNISLPSGSVAVTIDDGYLDTYTVAFPILKKYKIPATVFLTSALSPLEPLGQLPRLSSAHVREMCESGLVTFEAHGRNHLNLKQAIADPRVFEDETRGCGEDITHMTGRSPRFYAYAGGHRSNQISQKLHELGYEALFGITEGLVGKGTSLSRIWRIQVDRTMNPQLVKLRIIGPVDVYRFIVQAWRNRVVA